MIDLEMALAACKSSHYAPVVQDKEVEEVFGRYPENELYENMLPVSFHDFGWSKVCRALVDLDVLKEHMAVDESFESGASKPVTSCYNRILSFIDHTLKAQGSLCVEDALRSAEVVFTLKKYQAEVLLNAVKENPLLDDITFGRFYLEDDCWEVIAEILAANSTRNRLFLYDVLWDTRRFGVFARSLIVHGASLTCLDLLECDLVWDEEAAEHIKLIFEYCPNLEKIMFGGGNMKLDGGRMIGNAIANHMSVTSLSLYGFRYSEGFVFSLGIVNLLCMAFKAEKQLNCLKISDAEFGNDLDCLLHASTLVETFELWDVHFDANSNPQFFTSLKDNTKLKQLRLVSVSGLENLGSFDDLKYAMHNNMSLESIDLDRTHWSYNGKAALIEEALRQRLRQRDYLHVLREELPTVRVKVPTFGRVYLCGHPYAGKSQLAYSMMQEERKLFPKLCEKVLKRTKGIEIQVLKNDDDMQVALWDLAGQDIFPALHEHLFPKITTVCLYLFVFNPFEYCKNVFSGPKKSWEQALKDELNVWLRFLCTNSNISKGNLPHLVVVITHYDKFSRPRKSRKVIVEEVQEIIKEGCKHFHGRVKYEHVFCVNGQDRKDIQPILEFLYGHFRTVPVSCSDWVPDVCNDVNSYILKKQPKSSISKDHGNEPLMMVKDFDDFLRNANPSMKELPEGTRPKVFEAMRKYLHDVGTIIDISGEGLIVTNPNWLTKDFLGELMLIVGKQKCSQSQHGDGCVSSSELNDYFVKIFGSDVDYGTLRNILIGLHLCYEVEENKYFVPILYESSNLAPSTRAWSADIQHSKPQFLGLRLRCEMEKVSYLSTAVFSRFQVHMHGISKEIFDNSLIFKNMLNCIWMRYDGYEVLIEYDYLKGQHVDVLVKISRAHKTAMEDAWKFASDKILKEIRNFYAHPKGAPGVALVGEIIRKECVVRPTPCHLRGKSQAVSISQLKELLRHSIESFTVERLKECGRDALYHHTWPECEEAGFDGGFVAALDLLCGCPDARELQAKVNEICGKREEKSLELNEHEKTRNLIEKFGEILLAQSTGSMPSIPYCTSNDVDVCRRLAAKLNFVIPMKLHFMCESRQGEHLVPNQKGFDITVEQQNRELLRFVVQSSIKSIVVLAKVAMKSTIGVSGDLPFMPLFAGDETKVLFVGGAVIAEKLLNEVKFSEAMVGEGSASIEDWPYMKDELEPKLQGQYGALFGLYRIEYIEGFSKAREGWLCRKCIDKGKDAGIISKVSNVSLK